MELNKDSILSIVPESSKIGRLIAEKQPDGYFIHIEETPEVAARIKDARRKFENDKGAGNGLIMSVLTGVSLYDSGGTMLYHVTGATMLDKKETSVVSPKDVAPGTGVVIRLVSEQWPEVLEILKLDDQDIAKNLTKTKIIPPDARKITDTTGALYNGNVWELNGYGKNRVLIVEEAKKLGDKVTVRMANVEFSFTGLSGANASMGVGDKIVFRLKKPGVDVTEKGNIEEIYLVDKELVKRKPPDNL